MSANALLLRYQGGWLERTSAASITSLGRREALLGLGSAASREESYRVADQQLAEFGRAREEIVAAFAPRDDTEEPYLAFLVGDTVTVPDSTATPVARRVVALAVTEDVTDGRANIVPTLGDLIMSGVERLDQVTGKMAPGSTGGQAKVAQPATPAPQPEHP